MKCVMKNCHNEAEHARGVCPRHLKEHRKAIREGRTTWKELVEAGWALVLDTCLFPECESESVTRGLCAYCYQTMRDAVKKGITTWDEMIEKGWAKPAQPKSQTKRTRLYFIEQSKKEKASEEYI